MAAGVEVAGGVRSGEKQPGERDWEVYRLVVVEGKSTRAAAEALGISQTRVCQLVERVVQWIATVLPAAAEELSDEVRLMLAQQISVARLDHLYGEAMAAWRASQVSETFSRQQRQSELGETTEVTTLRREHGNIRYLTTAVNLCLKMAKLPAGVQLAISPPVEDCSLQPSEQPVALESIAQTEAETAAPAEFYDEPADPRDHFSAGPHSVFAPVQAALPAVTPATNLSRRERRARQKLLERTLRKPK